MKAFCCAIVCYGLAFDLVEEPRAEQGVSGVGYFTWGPTPGLAADVTRWLQSPGANFGWILISDEAEYPRAKRFDTRTHLDPARRPVLLLEVDVPLRLRSPVVASNHLTFSFTALAGQSYLVEQRVELGAGSWSVLTNIAAAAAPRSITVRQPLAPTRRFFRVLAP